jgi:SAM-dependent methyltransferase
MRLLDRVGSEDIWRSIYDADHVLLAAGHEDMRDGSPEVLSQINFRGRNVLDLGCNFGFYSFLAKRRGAKRVVGADIDARAIEGCELLQDLYGFVNMQFHALDFTSLDLTERFHIGMLINFIGKRSLRKGIQKVLDLLSRYSETTMVITARPSYDITGQLVTRPEQIIQHYGSSYIVGNRFDVMDYLKDFYGDQWHMSIISPDYADRTIKRTFVFTRK